MNQPHDGIPLVFHDDEFSGADDGAGFGRDRPPAKFHPPRPQGPKKAGPVGHGLRFSASKGVRNYVGMLVLTVFPEM